MGLALRDEIATASESPGDGFPLVLLDVEKHISDELGDSGVPTLDYKLAAALSKVMTGELRRQINLKKEQANA